MEIKTLFDCKPVSPINAVDFGHVLPPFSLLLIKEGDKVIVSGEIINEGEKKREIIVKANVPSLNEEKEEKFSLPPGEAKNLSWEIGPFPQGEHWISLIMESEGEKKDWEWRVLSKEAPHPPSFGAVYCDLQYDLPVLVYKEGKAEKKEWKELWRNGPLSDLVVFFPNNARLIFWRGASYIPLWHFTRSAFSYEWVEVVSPRPPEFVDCVEPLMDRECRYSRVALIHNTPARVLVHWRYALCDFNYRIYEDEWVDEYYYLYPDGVGVRKVVGWLAPGVKHEMNELIVVLPAGVHPNEVIPSQAVDFMDLEGNKEEVTWPRPHLAWPTGKPSIIRVKIKEPLHPFMITPGISEYLAVWDGWKENGKYVCPCYWGDHWPVTRGLNTVGGVPKGWKEGPAHASLVSMIQKSVEEQDVTSSIHKTVWAMLIGATNEGDEKLRLYASSWLNPGEAESLTPSLSSKGFDILERAYVFEVQGNPSQLKIRLSPPQGKRIVNPAFVFQDLEGKVKAITLDGELLSSSVYKWGMEREGCRSNLVIWMEKEIDKASIMEIDIENRD